MMFDGVNLIAVAAAAVGSFIFGSVWYGVLGKAWMKARAAALTKAGMDPIFK